MSILEILERLCALCSVSGREDCLFDEVSAIAKGLCVSRDAIGNIIISKPAKNEKRHIVLDAHCDQIGFKIVDFYSNGFLKLESVGGIDARTLLGERARVIESGVVGVFSSIPPHLQSSGDSKNYPKVSELGLDIGALSLEDAQKKVNLGDTVCVISHSEILNNKYFSASALDNKAGCAVMLWLINTIELENTSLTLLLSSQEEVGMRGAKAFSFSADEAISIDVTFGSSFGEDKMGELGKGAMIGVSPVLNRQMTERLFAVAEKNSIPYQKEIMGESTGTNADMLSLCTKTALVSIPIRNMHSAVEVLKICDLESTAELICEYLKEADRDE